MKFLRNKLNLTQKEFGRRISVTQATIAAYESGIRTPSNANIRSISKEFVVSERWLRTGEGSMRGELDRKNEIVSFVTSTLNAPESIQFKLISLLSKLTADDWDRISELAGQLAEDSGEK